MRNNNNPNNQLKSIIKMWKRREKLLKTGIGCAIILT